jgi:site-specific recombinase XerD
MTFKPNGLMSVDSGCALSSVVEHYLHTTPMAARNAPEFGAFSHGYPSSSNKPSNKVPNTRRFRRVERALHRHVRTGELWFVGRRGGKVVWHRLRTCDLHFARATVAMLESKPNGNSAISLVIDGKEQPVADEAVVASNQSLPRLRQVLVDAESPTPPGKVPPASRQTSSGSVPTLEELLVRWRRGKDGLKSGTLKKLDAHLTMMRRYVETHRSVTEYRVQDIRDYLAKARADKAKQGGHRLKGQTINLAVWRPLRDAFSLAQEEGFIPRNPMDLVKREKAEPINRKQLNWEDAERVLADVKARGNKESYLELKFMLFMGVGQAEARDFTGGAVDWKENQITFVRQKTCKQYTVPIYPWAEQFVRDEIQPRLKLGQPVFVWRNPRKALKTACLHLGVTNVDIRSLRRTLIIRLIQQKVDIRLIAKWQGHSDARLILSRYGTFIDAGYEKDALTQLC